MEPKSIFSLQTIVNLNCYPKNGVERKYSLPKGVRRDKNKYRPQISENGRTMGLGSFDTPDGAEIAYLAAKIARDGRYVDSANAVIESDIIKLAKLRNKLL